MMELIPGVQQGGRLTLTSLDKRLQDVERVLAQLVQDFYDGGNVPANTPDDFLTPTETAFVNNEITGLRAHVDHLRGIIDRQETDLAVYKSEIESLKLEVQDRENVIQRQHQQITNLSVDIDEFVRENDRLAEDIGNLMEERDEAMLQLREIRSVLL